jgi:hypothetical protein
MSLPIDGLPMAAGLTQPLTLSVKRFLQRTLTILLLAGSSIGVCTSCSNSPDPISSSPSPLQETQAHEISASHELGGRPISEGAEPSLSLDPPGTFHGYTCTVDCSGHEAGYQWAADHDIDDPDNCGGNSNSFIEGCRVYAEEQSQRSDDGEDGESRSQ